MIFCLLIAATFSIYLDKLLIVSTNRPELFVFAEIQIIVTRATRARPSPMRELRFGDLLESPRILVNPGKDPGFS